MTSKYNAEYSKPPSIDPLWKGEQSLGQKIETLLTRFIQRVISWGHEFVADLLVDIFDASMKIMRPGLSRATDPIINKLLEEQELPDYIKLALKQALVETGESSWIIKAMVFYTTISSTVFGGLAPFRRLAEYHIDDKARSFLPSANELATFHRLGLISDEAYKRTMSHLGVADPLFSVYAEMSRNLPNLGEVITGLWRGVYSKQDFDNALLRMGYDAKDNKLYTELAKQIPPISDLIHMLVRDAFNDVASAKYGYDEEVPEGLKEFFAKQGYDPDWVKRYWRAHWQLPSPNMAYEMLHRGQIDTKTMDELLKISDYPKFWRDKLTAISYNVYTRVDIRRLLQNGQLTEEEAFTAYKEAGYDDVKARKLTDFALTGASLDEKDLTRADVLGLYEKGLLARDVTKTSLIKLGYDEQEAEILLDKSDYNIAKSQRTDEINYIKEQFLGQKINTLEAGNQLTALGLRENQIDRYTLAWERQLEGTITYLSKADIIKLLKSGFIDRSLAEKKLREIHYRAEDIKLLLDEALTPIAGT